LWRARRPRSFIRLPHLLSLRRLPATWGKFPVFLSSSCPKLDPRPGASLVLPRRAPLPQWHPPPPRHPLLVLKAVSPPQSTAQPPVTSSPAVQSMDSMMIPGGSSKSPRPRPLGPRLSFHPCLSPPFSPTKCTLLRSGASPWKMPIAVISLITSSEQPHRTAYESLASGPSLESFEPPHFRIF